MTKSPPPFPSTLCRIVTFTALTTLLPACASPLMPTPLGPVTDRITDGSVSASNASLASNRDVLSFPLLNGVFSITLRTAEGSAGTISGTYTGQAVVAIPGKAVASLDLHITQTTGAGSLVTGLEGNGSGSFVDEGDFTLVLKVASSSSATRDGSKVTFRGSTQLACSASDRILVTQRATSSTRRFPEITIELQHEVGDTECFSRGL
jgi:hypothetical protein